jgi:hypothetical protein
VDREEQAGRQGEELASVKNIAEWAALLMIAAAAGLAGASAPVTFGFPPVLMDIVFAVTMAIILAYAIFSLRGFARSLKDEDIGE